MLFFAILVVLGVMFIPESAYAWGPSTHIFVGREIIAQAFSLPSPFSAVISSYPFDFLYGSIFADMSIGKKFLFFAKMVHNWKVGFSLKEKADSEPNLACALGYLAHLAADTISHNEFVPHKLIQHYDLHGKGHIFFEARFDALLPDKKVHKLSREIVKCGAEHNDPFLEKNLARTIFSFKTNSKIYRGILTMHRNNGIQLYRRFMAKSKNQISEDEVKLYLNKSLFAVLDVMQKGSRSKFCSFDPHGKQALKKAIALRAKLRSHHGLSLSPDEAVRLLEEV